MAYVFGLVFDRWRGVMVLLAVVAGQASVVRAAPPEVAADSSLVAAFLDLSPREQESRCRSAVDMAAQARKIPLGPKRRELQATAATTDLANTHYWLDLAETDLVMGYGPVAEVSLKTARTTIEFLSGRERRDAVRDYSLAMAWWYYSLGRWQDGSGWGERAVKYNAGLAGHLVTVLNGANRLHSLRDLKKKAQPFRPLDSGGNRRADYSWCRVLYFYLHGYQFDEMDVIHWLGRSIHHADHDAWRWRDFGLFCEVHEAGESAVRYYEKAARSLAGKDAAWLVRRERPLPSPGVPMPAMPFWTNPDGGYVTGSLLTHLGYVRDRMATAASETERSRWAENILAIQSRAARYYPNSPWPILWHGEALMTLGRWSDSLIELRLARDTFTMLGQTEPAVDRAQGHLLLLQKKYGKAAPMVQAAVAAFPNDAACWADLGLAAAYAGDKPAALKAFNRALELDETLAVAWYNRGMLMLRSGDPQAALADVSRAAALVPDNVQVGDDLARIQGIAGSAGGDR